NAVLHAVPPIHITLRSSAAGVRIEVADGSDRPPVRPAANVDAMTGRGLALVTALTTQWGCTAADGKVVWAELSADDKSEMSELDVDALIDAWAEDIDVDLEE